MRVASVARVGAGSTTLASVLFVAALSSCGPGAAMEPDSVAGTWQRSETATDSATVTTYVFAADGTWTSDVLTTYSSTAVLANCQLDIATTGGTYDTVLIDGVQRIDLTGTVTSSEMRSQCANASLNTVTTHFTRTRDSAGTYTLEGMTLTIMFEGADGRTGSTEVYTKQ